MATELIAPAPLWLTSARAVLRSRGMRAASRRARAAAERLLASVEAERLPAPAIRATDDGCVLLYWDEGGRWLALCVSGPFGFLFQASPCPDCGDRGPHRGACAAPGAVQGLRGLMEWLYPETHLMRDADTLLMP